MSELYKELSAGLTEAIEDAKSSEKKLKRRYVTIIPVKEYASDEIKAIREDLHTHKQRFFIKKS